MENHYEVIIIGGSAAGLAATLAIARTMKTVLCIDSGAPCNKFSDHMHNFIGHDGDSPVEFRSQAKDNLLKYKTVRLVEGKVIKVNKAKTEFQITATVRNTEKLYVGKKIIFASGVNDLINDVNIKDIEKFWGKSALHCPYCHGYEVANRATGLIFDNSRLMDMASMIYNWTKNITVLTNGTKISSICSESEQNELKRKNIEIIDKVITEFVGESGNLETVRFSDGSTISLDCVYIHPPFKLNCEDILNKLQVNIDETRLIKVDGFQRTNIEGVYACGDCTTYFRAVSNAVSQGNIAGAMCTKELFQNSWYE
ncbi:uncharacterized protein AC631_02258 [Debaryomyces fabryi]|uniref:FAD/NAD(P)-binding domain-containing protein n=1 Tax=Debaryomyces fabryi TaxID=58627 RepID=A0A0V1Q1A5_9ASCO|nr:uncharacterized protein AC631_02258 [Debaryomyces fabryi]KSA01967.1 hypothetical protein AC631_02258 [Debaryomyces fabryi]CUM54545.1 unnamed protein product [Debaryomyces fabryi]